MNKLFLFIALLALAMYLPACHTGKKATRKKRQTDSSIVSRPPDTAAMPANTAKITAEKRRLIDSLLPVWRHGIEYKTFAGKARMHYEAGDQKQDFTANIRVQKDNVIWVSATALGGIVQVARSRPQPLASLITPDERAAHDAFIAKELGSEPVWGWS